MFLTVNKFFTAKRVWPAWELSMLTQIMQLMNIQISLGNWDFIVISVINLTVIPRDIHRSLALMMYDQRLCYQLQRVQFWYYAHHQQISNNH